MKETGPFKEFRKAFNQVRDFLQTLVIHQSKNIKRRRTAVGTTLIGTAASAAEPGSGMTFTGTWAAGTYKFNDVAKVETGIHAGTYVAIEAVNSSDLAPHLSDKWVLIGRVNDNGITSG